MRTLVWGAVAFVLGFVAGYIYRTFCRKWCIEHVYSRIKGGDAEQGDTKIPLISWGSILLAVAVAVVSFSYWLDHKRWDEYLDCQDDFARATVPRQVAAADLNKQQTQYIRSQAELNAALNRVVDAFVSGGENPTPAQQEEAQRAFRALGVTAAEAAVASQKLSDQQVTYDEAIAANPLPVCGASPAQ